MGAAGEQCDAVVMRVGSTCEVAERKLLKGERNITKDVLWGLHG